MTDRKISICLRDAAREAGELALSYWGRSIEKSRKADGSAVTEADHAVDALLCERLRGARPDYGWLSEESADHEGRREARRVWVVDPIDGTRAFIQGRDDWTVALALVEDGAPVLAAVVNPARGETYEARAGEGAFLNGRRIHASERSALSGREADRARPLLKASRWRTPWPAASACLGELDPLSHGACRFGEADATFALKPKWEWDIAAGALLVSEAGGLVTDPADRRSASTQQRQKYADFLQPGRNCIKFWLERMGEAL